MVCHVLWKAGGGATSSSTHAAFLAPAPATTPTASLPLGPRSFWKRCGPLGPRSFWKRGGPLLLLLLLMMMTRRSYSHLMDLLLLLPVAMIHISDSLPTPMPTPPWPLAPLLLRPAGSPQILLEILELLRHRSRIQIQIRIHIVVPRIRRILGGQVERALATAPRPCPPPCARTAPQGGVQVAAVAALPPAVVGIRGTAPAAQVHHAAPARAAQVHHALPSRAAQVCAPTPAAPPCTPSHGAAARKWLWLKRLAAM